jgi:hypothetical protein
MRRRPPTGSVQENSADAGGAHRVAGIDATGAAVERDQRVVLDAR